MGLFAAIFGRPAARGHDQKRSRATAAPASTFGQSTSSGFGASTHGVAPGDPRHQFIVRRDLLRLVLRDITTRSGIPSAWIELRAMPATGSDKTQGIHARLMLKHWQPLILAHAPTLERLLMQRLIALDPIADQWLLGLSWQLSLAEEPAMEPLPRPGSWTAPARPMHSAEAPAARPGPSGDVIAGPVRIATLPRSDARGQLDRLLSAGDSRMRGASLDATQPAPLS